MYKLTNETFNETISSHEVVVVKLGAEFCGPCRVMDGTMASLESKFGKAGNVAFASCDVSEQEEIADKLNVRNIPVTIIYKHGGESFRKVGLMTENDLEAAINEAIR